MESWLRFEAAEDLCNTLHLDLLLALLDGVDVRAQINFLAEVVESGVVQVAFLPLEVSLVLLSLVEKFFLVCSFPCVCFIECIPVHTISLAISLRGKSLLAGDQGRGQQHALAVLLCRFSVTYRDRLTQRRIIQLAKVYVTASFLDLGLDNWKSQLFRFLSLLVPLFLFPGGDDHWILVSRARI